MRVREEITEWDKAPSTPNHIYLTEGTTLVGYIPRGTYVARYFNTPLKTRSPARRKFRELGKRELAQYTL